MEAVANKAGYNLIISQSAESFEKEIESADTMFNNRVDGLLVSLAYDTKNLDHFDRFLNKSIPVIFFDRTDAQSSYTNIVLDNEEAGFDATLHLIHQGCKRIVHITADSNRDTYTDRLSGYQHALKQAGIEYDELLILRGNLSIEFGRAAAAHILNMSPKPDGIFAANDNCAVSCMLYLKHQGGINIPEDIAVVGFNNDPVTIVVDPNLTTINYPGYEMGETAASHLISLLTGSQLLQKAKTILLHHELLVRASSLRTSFH
jgi:LacI family transcriptional regulator